MNPLSVSASLAARNVNEVHLLLAVKMAPLGNFPNVLCSQGGLVVRLKPNLAGVAVPVKDGGVRLGKRVDGFFDARRPQG